MYSGSTFNKYSGHVLGAHQKIDRMACRQLKQLAHNKKFPSIKTILHFEGDNGPDGIKRKSPAKDEPWHYIQPFDADDTQLIELIEEHYKQLVKALKAKDDIRSAFEAAWLAHAIVDGLTPAHHYPYEEKLVELSSGRGIEDRTTISKKLIMPGATVSHQFGNNWKMWGPKGLFTTHAAFEAGVAVLMAPLSRIGVVPTADKIDDFQAQSLASWFRTQAQNVARMELYDTFYETGWTIPLARRVRNQLVPTLVQSVTLVWHGASLEAAKCE
ncbi:MAG: hypothetical protein JWO35_559 [Candidatus Saccharibacteria bacterium]|nr:hypothetical protein [Candidatus Saccharibacteria bacterium]